MSLKVFQDHKCFDYFFFFLSVTLLWGYLCRGKKTKPKQQIPREIVLLAHNFIPVLTPLKIVTCVLQSLVRCVNDIKEKKNVQFLPPVNGILNYMLLLAVLWIQKDAFKQLDSKKYFHHKRFPGLWGERVEKYMTCYQVTPTE